MAKVTTELKVLIKTAGDAGLDKLTRTLSGLGRQAKSAAAPFDQISKELKEVQRTSKNSIANLRGYRNAWRDITQQVEIGSDAFREATAEAARLDKQLQKAEGRKARGGGGLGGKLRSVGGVASTALGAGIFGGVEGFGGALAGGLIGGVPGAAAGAVAGASLGQLRQQASGMGELVARVNGLKIALAGVSTSQEDYNVSLKSAIGFSKDFLIPIDDTIKQYTRLKAAVVGAGGSTKDTDKAFRGMAAAVLATGGDVQDFNSALVATAQVFSKGKVSAEELRQQIGERLPGAFTIFADSMGISTRELDKLLEGGKVDLSSFGAFTETLFERFGKTAEILGDAPEKAGQRLQVALAFASLEYGGFFQKVGAGFQNYATDLTNFAIDNKETFKEVLVNAIVFANDIQEIFKRTSQAIIGAFVVVGNFIEKNIKPIIDTIIPPVAALTRLILRADAPDIGRPVPRGEKSLEQKLTEARGIIDSFFAPFEPTSFGSGTGSSNQSLTGGEDAGGGGSQAKIRDTSAEVLRLTQEMNVAKKAGQLIAAEELRLELDIQKITEQFNDKKITFNRASELSSIAIAASQERTLRLQEQIAKQDQEKDKALNQIRLVTGEITQEEFDQEQITQKALELVKLFPGEFERVKAALEEAASPLGQFKKGLKEVFESAMDVKTAIGDVAVQAVSGLGDVFADFVVTGKANFAEFTRSVLADLARIFARAALFKTLSLIPGVGSFLGLADGGVLAKNKIVPFASGGVVNKPTIFPMANGMGLMGEAGPEAIMPLRRGANGKLGVEASGGTSNVTVNVDASGSSVEGNGDQAAQLGKAIGLAVQQELIKQKRPGGLLTS
ncbi:phage-related minor tail protein [uncultured Mediterranean phage MEDS5 group]|uniref:Phage-related minor tail protein n=1 Tax=uncultured Mediterranean phage MEDS5 group TaxID=1262075 RepID=K7YBG2_9CAUD|nr:phage-related minor tail protein [uncultured Mediterranean phage MEDS5 group]BAR24329.1 phage-related minor tail protein [uncultured Mediterranean phage uvMED]